MIAIPAFVYHLAIILPYLIAANNQCADTALKHIDVGDGA
jgi:hypothetical protein